MIVVDEKEKFVKLLSEQIKHLQLSVDDPYLPTSIKADAHRRQDLLKDILDAFSY